MRVLSLGGGQQSTAIYLLAATGEIAPIDYVIFADTGEEPRWVYETIEALKAWRHPETGQSGPPILVREVRDEAGQPVRLGDQLIDGNAGRFASIPAFIKHLNLFTRKGKNAQGKGRRQCTREFKTAVVEKTIREELLGLEKGEAYKGERITQVFGFDFSEGERIFKTKARLANGILSVGDFPLWDLQWKRSDCVAYLTEAPGWGGREVLESACTFCPLVTNKFRRQLKERDRGGYSRACAIDAGLRKPGASASKLLAGELYVHRSMKPLSDVDLDADDDQGKLDFDAVFVDCEGICGR